MDGLRFSEGLGASLNWLLSSGLLAVCLFVLSAFNLYFYLLKRERKYRYLAHAIVAAVTAVALTVAN
jgi:hypothetical protein